MSLSILRSCTKFLIAVLCMIMLTDTTESYAQVLKDSVSLRLVKKTINQMYSMNFSEADKICEQINTRYPDHPVVHLLKGMIIYWRNDPLMSGSAYSRAYEEQMHQCIEKCEKYDNDNEAEFLLANLCARGSLLLFYAANDLTSKAFSLGASSYKYVRRSFEFKESFPDFNFFTGLYNYYREAYPAAHPSYKPLFALLPKGDRVKGMNELKKAFSESIFMKAEASTFLSSNYKYFENDFENASYFSRTIYNKYPANTAYLINCIEDLLLTRKYDEAEKLIISPASRTNNRYYQAELIVLRGILNEKKYRNAAQAKQQYSIGVESLTHYSEYGSQFAAYAYFGLSRLSGDNSHDQKIYRRKAIELAEFPEVNFDN